jgi:hypothetical protein
MERIRPSGILRLATALASRLPEGVALTLV